MDNLNTLDENVDNSEITKEKDTQILNLTALRIIMCFFILSLCFILKSHNTFIFNKISSWYRSKICYESITPERIYNEFVFISSIATSYFNEIYLMFKN